MNYRAKNKAYALKERKPGEEYRIDELNNLPLIAHHRFGFGSGFVLFGGVQKAKGFGTFPGVYGMVNVMRPDNPLQVLVSGNESDFYPAMDNDIVKNGVEDAVEGNAQTHPEQKAPAGYVVANHDAGGGQHAEYHGKQVVFLPGALVVAVVRFVPAPHEAVHYVFMRKPGHAFHQKESAQHNQDIQQHTIYIE
jgi:hypothetical protein